MMLVATLLFLFLTAASVSVKASESPYPNEQTIFPPPVSTFFGGKDVVFSGDRMAINSWKTNGYFLNIYKLQRLGTWDLEAEIRTPDWFENLAFDGNRIVAAESTGLDGSGFVYIYDYVNGSWSTPPFSLEFTDVGFATLSVALSGDDLFVGTPGLDGYTGGVFHYTLNGFTPSLEEILVPEDVPESSNFGVSVAFDGTTLVAGCWSCPSDGVSRAGAVYAFQRDGDGDFVQVSRVATSPPGPDGLGYIVGISRDNIVASDTMDSVYVFSMSGEFLSQTYLRRQIFDMKVQGSKIVVGLKSVRVYNIEDDGTMKRIAKLQHSDRYEYEYYASRNDRFGYHVAVSEETDTVAVTADARQRVYLFGPELDDRCRITNLVLVDAELDEPILMLEDGQSVRFDELEGYHRDKLTIVAEASGNVDWVTFDLNGERVKRENLAPYALAGDRRNDFNAASDLEDSGEYTVLATPYSDDDAIECVATDISFSLP